MDKSGERKFFLRWVRATWAGWLLGIPLLILLALLGEALGIGGAQVFVGVGIGTGVGVAQARALRRHLASSTPWFWSCVEGRCGVSRAGSRRGTDSRRCYGSGAGSDSGTVKFTDHRACRALNDTACRTSWHTASLRQQGARRGSTDAEERDPAGRIGEGCRCGLSSPSRSPLGCPAAHGRTGAGRRGFPGPMGMSTTVAGSAGSSQRSVVVGPEKAV